jgi:hypothetical protein
MARHYIIDGKTLTAEEVAALENPTTEQKRQFAKQAGLSDRDLQSIEAMADALGPLMTRYVKDNVAPLVDRLLVVEAKAIEFENGGVRYEGVHQRAQSYRRGSVVTHKRAAWVALKNTNVGDIPDESSAWQLMVPAGRDAKDAK